jgi:hypothetical protein
MNGPARTALRFFRVMVTVQPYVNPVYLSAAFPLGVFYFAFLVTGFSTGISLTIVWVGIPILPGLGFGWRMLAAFERFLAVHLLKEDIPAINRAVREDADFWMRFKEHLSDPVTWKSPLYLLVKFPLGVASLVILVMLASLTVALLVMPVAVWLWQGFQIGAFTDPTLPGWQIATAGEAAVCVLMGLLLWPATLHVANGLARLHAKLARAMLGPGPFGGVPAHS